MLKAGVPFYDPLRSLRDLRSAGAAAKTKGETSLIKNGRDKEVQPV